MEDIDAAVKMDTPIDFQITRSEIMTVIALLDAEIKKDEKRGKRWTRRGEFYREWKAKNMNLRSRLLGRLGVR